MSKQNVANTFVESTSTFFANRKRKCTTKHTLDSDEEESENENILDADDIVGEEDGFDRQEGDQKMTAFNMKEEMEEGHFDKEGHFIWNNGKEIHDNWLDNIDWQKIKHSQGAENKYYITEAMLGPERDSDDENEKFDEVLSYKSMLQYMKPKESVDKALKRLGGDNIKLSSFERLKRKKAGILQDSKEIIHLTELANEILTKQGNMDIYQETYEQIAIKIKNYEKISFKTEAELDMYNDDFDEKEKQRITAMSLGNCEFLKTNNEQVLMWEFKWKHEDEVFYGPYPTTQMLKWSKENYFKDGVLVRKYGGNDTRIYTSTRIDFELYE